MPAAEALVLFLAAYAAAGLAFALWFAARGALRIDEEAARSGWAFRCILIPGAVALWPLLARRCRAARREVRA